MALKPGTSERLLAEHAYRSGALSVELLKAFLKDIEDHAPTVADVPNPRWVKVATAGQTAKSVVAAACRLYGVRVESPSGATGDVIVGFLDGTVPIQCGVKCVQKKVAEAFIKAGSDGFGVPIATSLNVKAFAASDGTSDPAGGDKPTVYVLVG